MEALKDEYVLDASYTWGFYFNQSPTLLDYVAKIKGVDRPPFGEPFTYCELGCGNGLTATLLADALPQGTFIAVDMNPQHITNAKRIAEKSGINNITFLEKQFEDFLKLKDLPQFDYITLHGVYTWVSADIRQEILDIIKKMLKPSGLVYVSYNSMPGWAELLPLREIMLSYTRHTKDSSLDKAHKGLQYLKYLRDNQAAYFQKHSHASTFLDKMLGEELSYIVHEYFNESWEPLYFSQVATDMAQIGLQFCGSGELIKNYPDIVPRRFRTLLDSATSVFHYENHKSLILDESFRCDVYHQPTTSVSPENHMALFANTIVGAGVAGKYIKREIQVGHHTISYTGKLYDDIIEVASDGLLTIAEICEHPTMATHSKEEILLAINKLIVTRQFQVFAKKSISTQQNLPKRFKISSQFNKLMLNERLLKDNGCYLSSPILGSGRKIQLIHGLLLSGIHLADPKDIIDHALQRLHQSGKTWVRHNQEIKDLEEQQKIMRAELHLFNELWIPALYHHGIIEAD